MDCSPWGCWESDTTERFHFHFSLSCIGEGNGNPYLCSCLENPGGAWRAAVYGVSQSRKWLKWLSSSRAELARRRTHTHTHTLSLSLSIRGYVVIRVSCKCFWLFWQSWPKIKLCITWLLLIMWIKLPDSFWNLKTFWHWKLEKKTNPFVSFHVNDEQPSGGNHEINAWNHSSMDTNNGLK